MRSRLRACRQAGAHDGAGDAGTANAVRAQRAMKVLVTGEECVRHRRMDVP